MATAEELVLWTHIAAGSIALVAGLGALVAKKGGRRHVRSGRVYVGSMTIVVVTVFGLTLLDATVPRRVLALVAVFSGYFVFAGYRVATRKGQSNDPRMIDWWAVGLLVIVGVGLLGWGSSQVVTGNRFGVVMAVFGGIAILTGYKDVRRFRDRDRNPGWMADHLGNMIGAYVATVTAVSAVNLTMLSPLVRWLWPTLLGVPLIWYWQATYGNTGPFVRFVSN